MLKHVIWPHKILKSLWPWDQKGSKIKELFCFSFHSIYSSKRQVLFLFQSILRFYLIKRVIIYIYIIICSGRSSSLAIGMAWSSVLITLFNSWITNPFLCDHIAVSNLRFWLFNHEKIEFQFVYIYVYIRISKMDLFTIDCISVLQVFNPLFNPYDAS